MAPRSETISSATEKDMKLRLNELKKVTPPQPVVLQDEDVTGGTTCLTTCARTCSITECKPGKNGTICN